MRAAKLHAFSQKNLIALTLGGCELVGMTVLSEFVNALVKALIFEMRYCKLVV
jgi:hypothetical protein